MSNTDIDKERHEGVIQFRLDWHQAGTIHTDLASLNAWRDILWKLGLIGEDPARYDGYGFGNVSRRHGKDDRFIISGTQTGHIEHLSPEHYALVTRFDVASNSVSAEGPVKPSSESMTHGVIYALHEDINCILHVHSPDIWQAAEALGLPSTDASVPYGTPAMAEEVKRLFTDTEVTQAGIFSMAGHRDGIVAFGDSEQQAGLVLVSTLAQCLSR